MGKGVFVSMLLCTLVIIVSAQVGMVYEFEPVIVLASRYNQSVQDFPGQVVVITDEEIRDLKISSIEEILDKICGLDIKYRGPEGVQADPELRGFSFNQLLVLINGMQINDPQTGHHTLDIPIDINDVERIEIISGGNSYINGANAFGGTINIVTKKSQEERCFLESLVGDNNFRSVFSRLNLNKNSNNLFVSYRYKSSDGYIHNTDFCLKGVNLVGTGKLAGFDASLTAGYHVKDFGANSFYTEKYKDQREDTKSFFSGLSLKKSSAGKSFSMSIYHRYHYDHFLLDYKNPAFYENFHRKNTIGLEVEYLLTLHKAIVSTSLRVNNDCINSERLGNHSRNFFGLTLGSLFQLFPKASINVSGYLSYYDKWGFKLWPGGSLSFKPGRESLLYLNANRSFRIPTYTELFYNSPANLGNENLKPENVWCFELGYKYISSRWKVEVSSFYNKARNLIDWVRTKNEDPWKAENQGKINILGFEVVSGRGFDFIVPSDFRIGLLVNKYYYDEDTNYQSKYVLNSAKFKLNIEYKVFPSESTTGNIFVKIFQRYGQDLVTVVDVAMSKANPFHFLPGVELFLKINNVFDRIYYGYQGVQLPGRWIKFGINYRIK